MPHLIKTLPIYLILVSFLSAAQYHYAGTLEQVSRDGSAVQVKEFQVDLFFPTEGSPRAFYVLEENNPALPWIEHFGEINSKEIILSKSGVAIGYRHLERNYAIPVGLPLFADFAKLQPDAAWKTTEGTFSVAGEKAVNDHPCWEVKATIGIARHHVFYVRKSSPIIEAATQTVFMGPGDRFRLEVKRAKEVIDAVDKEALIKTIQVLGKMKSRVERDEFNRFQPLNPKQLKTLATSLPQLATHSKGTELESFAQEVEKDVRVRLSRNSRVEDLAGTMLGRPVPKFTLQSLDGNDISSTSFLGKTVVIHFWDYANSSLEQPYGQVGYLDFINNRWSDKGILVYGVAINSQLNDPQTKRKAIREIQKLKQFMKLSYEIMIDPGSVLNSFGNPTRLGEELPLWVVISPSGKIVHYQTGFYEVDNRVGLKEIHETLEKQSQQQK